MLLFNSHRVSERGEVWRVRHNRAHSKIERSPVSSAPIGTPLDPRNVTREFHALLTEAGLPAIRFHDLRHTAATLLLAQGVDVRTIMETLGHSQISLTLNTYSHVLPALQAEAAAKMDAILTR